MVRPTMPVFIFLVVFKTSAGVEGFSNMNWSNNQMDDLFQSSIKFHFSKYEEMCQCARNLDDLIRDKLQSVIMEHSDCMDTCMDNYQTVEELTAEIGDVISCMENCGKSARSETIKKLKQVPGVTLPDDSVLRQFCNSRFCCDCGDAKTTTWSKEAADGYSGSIEESAEPGSNPRGRMRRPRWKGSSRGTHHERIGSRHGGPADAKEDEETSAESYSGLNGFTSKESDSQSTQDSALPGSNSRGRMTGRRWKGSSRGTRHERTGRRNGGPADAKEDEESSAESSTQWSGESASSRKSGTEGLMEDTENDPLPIRVNEKERRLELDPEREYLSPVRDLEVLKMEIVSLLSGEPWGCVTEAARWQCFTTTDP